jgi:Clp amino terminal domain, pathogenicity island component
MAQAIAMFERFTARARRTIVLAQEEARNLQHNYIGTEHILLGLLSEGEGIGPRALAQFGIKLDGVREEVASTIGLGQKAPTGHIPFTPRAKKVLELALREALSLHHNYIGTEHILLGLIRENDGVAVQILKKHADLAQLRTTTIEVLGVHYPASEARSRNWLRRVSAALGRPVEGDISGEGLQQPELSATPAADVTLTTAAQLAGGDPVGSHHLLLAALTDANSAAARVLASLGVDLTRAKDALHNADITGTTDELPEDAGRRQMNIKVSDEIVTIVLTDEILVQSANAALKALRERPGAGAPASLQAAEQEGTAAPGDVIRGADLSGLPAVNLAKAWTGLHEALAAITTSARAAAQGEAAKAAATPAESSQPAQPGPADSAQTGTGAQTGTSSETGASSTEGGASTEAGPGTDAEAAAE